VALATNRGLMLIGEPGTAKSYLSELLAAAISGDSTLTVQGSAGTTEDNIKARLVGLGRGARIGRGGALLSAYLQDTDSGTVVALERSFADPDAGGEEPAALSDLAARVFHSGVSLLALGAGQPLVDGARRSASHRLILGRSRASFAPQAFAWETLRAPVLAADFAEVRARLAGLPPASLRPRRVAEDLHVCPVRSVEDLWFRAAEQTVEAILVDDRGERARLVRPFTARGASGCEALLRARHGPPVEIPVDPIAEIPQRMLTALGELLLLGLERTTASTAAEWQELCRASEAMDFDRLVRPAAHLAAWLEEKRGTVRWDPRPASGQVLEVALLACLATEL